MPRTPGRPHPRRSLMILALAGLAFSLAQTTVIPALGDIKDRLGTDETGAAWTLTAYLLSAAIATPLAGRLGDMFGKRRMLVLSLLVFGAGSIVSAAGDTLAVMIAGRLLQGVGGGIFPLCFGIIRDEFPREKVAGGIGVISAILGVGGGLGLVLGGVLVDGTSYHAIFWLGAGMALCAAGATWLLVPESPVRTRGRVDFRGAFVLSLGLTPPLLAFSQGNAWGWSDVRTLGLVGFGALVLAAWVPLQRRTASPLANVRTLGTPAVLMTNLATLFIGFGMFGSFLLIPQLAQAPESTGYGFGLDATGAGVLMLPGALVMLFSGPLSGRMGGRFGSRVPLAAGAGMTAVGLVWLGVAHGTQLHIVVGNVLTSIGFGAAFAAMPNLIVDAVPPEETGEATGFNALVRSAGSSIGSQVSAAILAAGALAAAPTDAAFTTAFLVCGVVAGLAAVLAWLIPQPRATRMGSTAELAAAAPFGRPAYVAEAA